MTAPNGRANGSAIYNPRELMAPTVTPFAIMSSSSGSQFSTDQIKETRCCRVIIRGNKKIEIRTYNGKEWSDTHQSWRLSGSLGLFALALFLLR